MGVTKPTSGSTITKQSVTGMHDTVRTNINAVDPQLVGPSSFGIAQMNTSSSPLVGFDFVNKDASTTITMNTFGNNDLPSDVIPNWQRLNDFELDNGGAGFTTVGASKYVVYFTCQVTLAKLVALTVSPSELIHVCFAITHEDSLGVETVIQESIMCYGLYGVKDTTTFFDQEIPVALWAEFGLESGKIIDHIRIYSCLLRGGAAAGSMDKVEITAGTSGCFVFERV